MLILKLSSIQMHLSPLYIHTYTGAREQIIMKVRVRKKVSILLKAPEAPLFKSVN